MSHHTASPKPIGASASACPLYWMAASATLRRKLRLQAASSCFEKTYKQIPGGRPLSAVTGAGTGRGSGYPRDTPAWTPPQPQPAPPRLLPARLQPSWPRPFLTRPSLSSPASLASPPFPGPSHPLASLTGRLPAATAPGSEAAVKGQAAWQGGRSALPTPGLACRPPAGPSPAAPRFYITVPGQGWGRGAGVPVTGRRQPAARAPPDSVLIPAPAPCRPGLEPRRRHLLGQRPSSAPRPARPPAQAPAGPGRRAAGLTCGCGGGSGAGSGSTAGAAAPLHAASGLFCLCPS